MNASEKSINDASNMVYHQILKFKALAIDLTALN